MGMRNAVKRKSLVLKKYRIVLKEDKDLPIDLPTTVKKDMPVTLLNVKTSEKFKFETQTKASEYLGYTVQAIQGAKKRKGRSID